MWPDCNHPRQRSPPGHSLRLRLLSSPMLRLDFGHFVLAGRAGISYDRVSLAQRTLSQEKPDALAAFRDDSAAGSLCATLFRAGLAPCPSAGPRGAAGTGQTHREQLLAGDGLGAGAPLYQLSSGVEPGTMVGPASRADSAGADRPAAGARRGCPRTGGRRYRGAAQRAPDQSQGVLPRCRTLFPHTWGALCWVEVCLDDGLGPRPLGPAGVGLALFDGAVLAKG